MDKNTDPLIVFLTLAVKKSKIKWSNVFTYFFKQGLNTKIVHQELKLKYATSKTGIRNFC